MSPGAEAWTRALCALALLSVDPAGLGGIRVRARAGPVRDRFLAGLAAAPRPVRRLGAGIGDASLFGGADAAGTLAAGRLVTTRGLVHETPSVLVVPMAERLTPGMGARLAHLIEAAHAAIALDEGAGPDELPPEALVERLALCVDLDAIALGDSGDDMATMGQIEQARTVLPSVAVEAAVAPLTTLAAALGIPSLRAPWFALRAARAAAALDGRRQIDEPDLALAAALVLGPRATRIPQAEEAPEEERRRDAESPADAPGRSGEVEDRVLQAALTALPPGLLERIAGRAPARAVGEGGGPRRKGGQRGRPLPSRAGRPDRGARIDVFATLVAAAPWQAVRAGSSSAPIVVRTEDVRLRRYETRSDRLLVFVVDASGSAAQARLAEAKGAVEILLGEAYVRRDHVALVAFRRDAAEEVVPPTRSLTRARRQLAGQPAGGATPLAHGLRAGLRLCEAARGRGMVPTLALLTDGRANIALDGTVDRNVAREDAETAARALRAQGIACLVLDIGARPAPGLAELARIMDAPCIALPRADAGRISAAVRAAQVPR